MLQEHPQMVFCAAVFAALTLGACASTNDSTPDIVDAGHSLPKDSGTQTQPDASMSSAPDSGTMDSGMQMGSCPERSAAFPFEDKFVTVTPQGLPEASIRYVESGSGPDTFVLIHGIPASAYLWRNVIPGLAQKGRVIALDLVGYGKSYRPETHPTFPQHANYLKAFLEALSIQNPVLFVHDLGGMAGLIYAANNPGTIKALAIMESAIPPVVPASSSASPSGCMAQQLDHPVCFWAFLKTEMGQKAIVDDNFFIEGAVASEPVCPVTEEAMAIYRADWPTPDSRRPLLGVPAEIAIDGQPEASYQEVVRFSNWLMTSQVEKLIIYATPGTLIPEPVARYAEANFPKTQIKSFGPGAHFLQEVNPQRVSELFNVWYDEKVK